MQALISPFWLFAAAFAYALSWLIPNHFPPWTSFHADAMAGLVALVLAAGVAWRSNKKLHLMPSVVLAALALLVLICQYSFGMVEKFGTAWMNALYIMGFIAAMLIGNVWERSKALECADFVFAAALIGSVVSWSMQLQQWLDVYWLKDWLLYSNERYSANLAQPNQLASLQTLGIIACAWFYTRGKFTAVIAVTLALALFFGLALANSRTSWVSMIVILASLILYRKHTGISALIKPVVILSIIYTLFILALPHIDAFIYGEDRAYALRSVTDTSGRLSIWQTLMHGVLLKPWLGYGWGQISYVQFMSELPPFHFGTPINESHNLPLDLLIYNGIPLGLFFIIAFSYCILKTLRQIKSSQQLMLALSLAVLLIHAMLEYPLEYAYFLIPFGLITGALSASVGAKAVFIASKQMLWPILILLAAAYGVTVSDYLKAEAKFYGLRFEHQRIATSVSPTPPDVIALTQLRDSLVLARLKPENGYSLRDTAWAESVAKSYPTTFTIFKVASMHAFAGQAASAQFWMRTVNRLSPPRQCFAFAALWQEQAALHPAMARVKLDPCPTPVAPVPADAPEKTNSTTGVQSKP